MAKAPDAFRTISEVADWLGTPAHVLRFWESKFSQVKPVKRAGGRRYYRRQDMVLLGGIKKLLHEDGLTIKAVQQLLRQEGAKHVAGMCALSLDSDLGEDDNVVQLQQPGHEPEVAPPDAPEESLVDDEADAQDNNAASDVAAEQEDAGPALDDVPEAEPPAPDLFTPPEEVASAEPEPPSLEHVDDPAPDETFAASSNVAGTPDIPEIERPPEDAAEEAPSEEAEEAAAPGAVPSFLSPPDAPSEEPPAPIEEPEVIQDLPSFLTREEPKPEPLGTEIPADPAEDAIAGHSGIVSSIAAADRDAIFDNAPRIAALLGQLTAVKGRQPQV